MGLFFLECSSFVQVAYNEQFNFSNDENRSIEHEEKYLNWKEKIAL